MSFFPASYSTLSPSALGFLVSERYGLVNVKCQFLVRGVGDTYLVESTDRRYILRIYRSLHRSLPQINTEMELLLALKQAGVSVSYPIHDLSGELIQALEAAEGLRHAALFAFAPGRPVRILNEKQLRMLGDQMARFHNVSSTIKLENNRWNFDFETTIFGPLEMLKPRFADNPEDYVWLEQTARLAIKKLEQLTLSEFSTGYCQFDFLPKNFHFEDDLITFFDFDFMGYGWLANDLMTFWQQLCMDIYAGRMTQSAADIAYSIFVDAYRDQRHLSEQELEAVPYLALGFWLFFMGFHTTHDQFFPFSQASHLKLLIGFLRQLVEKYWNMEAGFSAGSSGTI